jgi:hypothetical protein
MCRLSLLFLVQIIFVVLVEYEMEGTDTEKAVYLRGLSASERQGSGGTNLVQSDNGK